MKPEQHPEIFSSVILKRITLFQKRPKIDRITSAKPMILMNNFLKKYKTMFHNIILQKKLIISLFFFDI